MKTSRQMLGAWGEERAAIYLEKKGYTILDRNARTPYGEIDLIARQLLSVTNSNVSQNTKSRSMIVFVEVRTRSTDSFGYPEQSINRRKQEHMLASAQAYLQEHPHLEDEWRIDVIAVRRFRDSRPVEIIHFENAIT